MKTANPYFMEEAIKEAKAAFDEGEIPIGCVIVKGDEIIARAHNTAEREHDPTCHAEISAIRSAVKKAGKYLSECEMYVTAEPCAMCAGAIVNCKLGQLYYGVKEPKTGCCGSNYMIVDDDRFNWRIAPVGGMLERECETILKKFFEEKRKKC